MTEEEIEAEVQERVRFKMNELKTGVKNRANVLWSIAFINASQKHTHYWEAFEEFKNMIDKESKMPTPRNDMYKHKLTLRKNETIQKIMTRLDRLFRGRREYENIEQFVASEINTLTNTI